MFTHINWLLKSMKRFPSGVQKYTPFARATAIGSTFDWADHSNKVCFRDSAIISSPVIVFSVSVAISACPLLLQHRIALRLELVPGFPFRDAVRLRDAVADSE